MLAQQNLYALLRGRRRASPDTIWQRGQTLPGFDLAKSQSLQAAYASPSIIAFDDGSYLEYRDEVRTWVAYHERWERKYNGDIE
jgi:hypothetical protein